MTIEPSEINESLNPWYLLQARSNFEDKSAEALRKGVEDRGLQNTINNVIVPKEEIQALKNGRKTVTHRRLYPGYIMVQMKLNDDVWHLVKKTPYVLGFVGGDRPSPMKKHEVEHIFELMQASASAPKHKIEYTIGSEVRVTEGPFKDFNVTIEHADYNRNRLKVSVVIFGRQTLVEIGFADVEQV